MAIAYSKVDQRNLANAVKKAKQVKPHVKVLDFGKFEVIGSEGKPYQVEFFKQDGEFTFSCTCPGHKKNFVCYHTCACSSIYKKQVADRAAEKAASAELPSCHDCGAPAFGYVQDNWFCIDCLTEAQAQEVYSQLSPKELTEADLIPQEEIDAGLWGQPVSDAEAIAAGCCKRPNCCKLSDYEDGYCEECHEEALKLADAAACLFG